MNRSVVAIPFPFVCGERDGPTFRAAKSSKSRRGIARRAKHLRFAPEPFRYAELATGEAAPPDPPSSKQLA